MAERGTQVFLGPTERTNMKTAINKLVEHIREEGDKK